MKNLYLSAVIMVVLSANSPSISATSMDNDSDINKVRLWIPSHFSKEQIIQVNTVIKEEKHLEVQPNEERTDIDFGHSVPGVNLAQELCLSEIKKRYEQYEERPNTADFGAGHGYMSWKMLIAGGDVYAVEPQEPTREILIQNAGQAALFLKKGEKLEEFFRCSEVSVLSFDLCPAYKGKEDHYDITWSGNLIHFFTPSEAAGYVHNLYKITKPGGYSFASVSTVYSVFQSQKLLDFFLQRKKEGKEFPGYFLQNSVGSRRLYKSQIVGTELIKSGQYTYYASDFTETDEYISVDDLAPENIPSPTRRIKGLYGSREEHNHSVGPDENGVFSILQQQFIHQAVHYFDKDSFSKLFNTAGFVVEDVFYMDLESNTRFDSTFSFETMVFDQTMFIDVGIKAFKPL